MNRSDALTPTSLAELLAIPSDQLDRVDIALMNLLCAEGLPGSETLNVAAVLAKLDAWAVAVKHETERHSYRVTDPKHADHYRHSENYFRAEFLLQTLQETLGVRYNPESMNTLSFADSRDNFLHGLADPQHGGTCASMPVLYVAIGRMLGYPISLVMARGHVFCRWEGPNGERFNIEGTNGFSSYPDEYYHRWPLVLADEHLATREYLVSLTPKEELAVFMAARGHSFMDLKRFEEAEVAYQAMTRLAPTFAVHRIFLDAAQLAVNKGHAEYERVYGKVPNRIEPSARPEELADDPRGSP